MILLLLRNCDFATVVNVNVSDMCALGKGSSSPKASPPTGREPAALNR